MKKLITKIAKLFGLRVTFAKGFSPDGPTVLLIYIWWIKDEK